MKYAYSILLVAALAMASASDAWASRGSVTLKRISRAVAIMAIEVSRADTENESAALAETAHRRLDVYLAGLPDFHADVQAALGYCAILVASDEYVIWGEASQGTLTSAGVDYSR